MTLFVHFYGGPATGKSTTNALVFGRLKTLGYNTEMIHEAAKDLAWDGLLDHPSSNQIDITAEQMRRLRRVDGKVDIGLTDTSTLLALVYGDKSSGVTPAFIAWALEHYRSLDTLNIYLERDLDRPYNQAGRAQTQAEALEADFKIKLLLLKNHISYHTVYVDKDANSHVDEIVRLIESNL